MFVPYSETRNPQRLPLKKRPPGHVEFEVSLIHLIHRGDLLIQTSEAVEQIKNEDVKLGIICDWLDCLGKK